MAASGPSEERKLGGARELQRAQARSRLLRAAKVTFEEKGYVETRIGDIAKRAGVSHGLFYHYFESKQEVFRALAAALHQELADAMKVAFDRASAATPYERLHAAVSLHFRRYRDEARMMSVIDEASRYDPAIGAARQALHTEENARLSHAIEQLQSHGRADKRLDPTVAATIIGSMTWRLAERWFLHGELDRDLDDGVAQLMLFLTNGLQFPNTSEGPPR